MCVLCLETFVCGKKKGEDEYTIAIINSPAARCSVTIRDTLHIILYYIIMITFTSHRPNGVTDGRISCTGEPTKGSLNDINVHCTRQGVGRSRGKHWLWATARLSSAASSDHHYIRYNTFSHRNFQNPTAAIL